MTLKISRYLLVYAKDFRAFGVADIRRFRFSFFGRRGRAIRTEVHARADDFSSMVSHFGNIDPSSSVFGSQLLAVSNAYRVSSPQTLRLCISYEISLYVLLPMTIQLSMSGQPSHPMKSLTSHKAPCRCELAHSKQFFSR